MTAPFFKPGGGFLMPSLPDDFADGYDDYSPDDDETPCPECGGSGLEIEGWDCWYCEGLGYLDI
jgi:hypothetical protein